MALRARLIEINPRDVSLLQELTIDFVSLGAHDVAWRWTERLMDIVSYHWRVRETVLEVLSATNQTDKLHELLSGTEQPLRVQRRMAKERVDQAARNGDSVQETDWRLEVVRLATVAVDTGTAPSFTQVSHDTVDLFLDYSMNMQILYGRESEDIYRAITELDKPGIAFQQGIAFALLGEHDKAMDCLEYAQDAQHFNALWKLDDYGVTSDANGLFHGLSETQRFKALYAKIGFDNTKLLAWVREHQPGLLLMSASAI